MAARGSRGLVLALALRAIRWRAAPSLTVFAVAVIAILAATVGPIYLHAVQETVLSTHLARASDYERDVLVSRTTETGFANLDWNAQVHRLATQIARDRRFAAPVAEQQVDVTYGSAAASFKTELAAIQGLCSHLHMVSGRCVSGTSTSQAVIATSTAAIEHLTVGGTLDARTGSGVTIALEVVGIYRPIAPAGRYWEPWNLFPYGTPPPLNSTPLADALFVTPAALSSRVQRVQQTLSANLALRPGAPAYDDIGAVRKTLSQAAATVHQLSYRAASDGTPVASVTTGLPAIFAAVAGETSLARTLVTLATAQLALLAIFLLYAVVANTTAAQGAEVALAKLRGRRTSSILLQSVAQPILLVLMAAPVAALLAWLIVGLLARHLLGHPVDVTFPPSAYAVAALGVVGGILAAAVAARRIIVTPVGALMRRGAEPGSSVGLLVADGAAVTLALAGLIELKAGGVLNSGKPNPLSVLAPTLLAVAVGVLALRGLPLLLRGLARWTRDTPRLATFLAVRHLLRRPTEVRAVLLVAVALSIATFALSGWSAARHNRQLRALNEVGASTVLIVRPGAGVEDLRTAVDRADPSGQAMAVAYTHADDGLPPMIAVDTARYRAVGAWVAGNASVPLGSILRRLAGDRPPFVTLTGTRLRLRIDLTRHPRQAVRLALNLSAPGQQPAAVTIAPIAPGRGVYAVRLPATCARGCRLTALHFTANTPDPDNGGGNSSDIDAVMDASVRGGGGWRPVPSLGDADRWRGNGRGPVAVHGAGTSLSLRVRQTAGYAPWPTITAAAIPLTLPGVVASEQAALYRGDAIHSIDAIGLDGDTVTVDGVIRSLTLPRLDRNGIMVDFGADLAAMRTTPAVATQYEVWLSPSAPRDMAARLAREHVSVIHTIHASTYRIQLNDSGPAYADSLFVIAALAATVLAVAATAVGRVVTVRRRAYELAALEAVGVSPRTLRRATAAELGVVFMVGLAVGLVAGLVGARLALGSTPVFVDPANGPPLVSGLPWGLLGALTLGMIVVFVVVSLVISRLVQRAATPSQLRGAQG